MNDSNSQQTPLDLFGDLTIGKHQFTLLFQQDAELPDFPSIGLRGLMGWSLQETVCPFQNQKYKCGKCMVNSDCPYFCLYEQKTKKSGFAEAPKGYMLYSAPKPTGTQITLELTLFGKCNQFLPAVSSALFASGTKGLSGRNNQFIITAWSEITPSGTNELPISTSGHKSIHGPFPLSDWLNNEIHTALKLTTPIRLRKKGRNLKKMDWQFFYSSLARRLEGLNQLYGNGCGFGRDPWLAVHKEFKTWSQPIGKTKWLDLNRYSSRQKKKVPLGGLTGHVTIPQPSNTQDQWLQIASLINVGKGAVMGLGRVKLL